MKYTNFHQHSHFSNSGGFLDGYGTISQIVSHCKSIGYDTVALTDHGSVGGHIELIRECKKEGLKPACGCEVYVVDDIEKMKKIKKKQPLNDKESTQGDENLSYDEEEKQKARQKYHFNVIAKNKKGLVALWELVSKSWDEGFYFKPTTSWDEIEKNKENFWIGSACEIGPLGRIIEKVKQRVLHENDLEDTEENEALWRNEAKEELKNRILELKEKFGDSFYIEIIPVPDKRARWKYLMIHEAAKELGCLIICTNDSHAPTKEDTIYQDIIYCAGQRRSNPKAIYNSPDRNRYTPGLFYIHSAEEMLTRMKEVFPEISEEDILSMMENTEVISKGIEIVEEPKVPAVAYSHINDTEDEKLNLYTEIQRLIEEGWKFREFDKLPLEKQKIYKERIKREFEVISNKGYIDYFLIFADIMNWCETDRPIVENFDLWMKLNADTLYPGKTKDEIYEELKNLKYFEKKEPIATGIARGSAGGSLVTYLLKITNIDPMPGGLLFERFIDYTRGNVYYELNFDTYTKEQFLKEFPEEDTNRIKELKDLYKDWFRNAIKEFLKENPWYNPVQVKREFWLLSHNQQFSREEEYFFTLLDKVRKNEIGTSNKNKKHSILAFIARITSKLVRTDYVVNLTDIPDIDSDFEDARRNEVYLYLRNRYGYKYSARIATYTVLKDKSAIDLLSRIFPSEDSKREVKELKEFLEEYKKENDISSLKSIKPHQVDDFLENLPATLTHIEFLPYIKKLLGQIIAFGMHPAGIIIHNNEISHYGSIYQTRDKETGKKEAVLCWDCGVAESMGLMKLDILGLNTVTNLKTINKLVEERHDFKHHWQRIPGVYEDEKTKELMKSIDWVGLFQLEGSIMTLLGKVVKPDSIEKVSFVSAGGRPGPLEAAMKYGELESGSLEPNYYDNEIYKNITKNNYGILIYQEDIMKLSRDLCKYEDAMVGKIRKLISKSKFDDLQKLEPDFIERCIKHGGMEEDKAKELWDSLTNFGKYAFNKSHSEAYGLFGWIGGYYKANYPLEFYLGMLQTLKQVSGKVVGTSKDKVYQLLKDYKEHNYKILLPSINDSDETFKIDIDSQTGEEAIRIGFNYIKDIGPKPSANIKLNQPYTDYEDFLARVDRRIVNVKVINACLNMGLFNLIGGAPDLNVKLVPAITYLEETIEALSKTRQLFLEFDYDLLEEVLGLLSYKPEAIEKHMLEKKEKDLFYFTLEDFKKIKSKIASRLKSLITKTRAETEVDGKIKKAGIIETKKDYEQDLLYWRDILDKILKELNSQERYHRKTGGYNVEEVEEEVETNIRKYLKHKEGECKCGKENFKNYHNIYLGVGDYFGNIEDLLREITIELGFSKEKVIKSLSYKDYLEYCPVLAKADLKAYAPILPYLDNFQALKNVDFLSDIYSATFLGVLVEKVILPENENKRKMRAKLTLKIGEVEKNVFVSGGTFEKNEEQIKNLKLGDGVILRGSARAGNFHMISLNQCDNLDFVYNKLTVYLEEKNYYLKLKEEGKKRRFTDEELFFLNSFKEKRKNIFSPRIKEYFKK